MKPQSKQHTVFVIVIAILVTLLLGKTSYANNPDSSIPAMVKLEEGTSTAQIWWWGWAFGYATLTVGQGIVALATSDRDLRVNMLVGSASSLLGLGFVLITDFPARYASAELRAIKEDTEEARSAKQKRARELLRASAEAEIDGRSWVVHLLGASVAVAQGLILWLAFDLPVDGIVNATVSLAISEAQIWTQPTRAIDDWQAVSSDDSEIRLSIRPTPYGVAFALLY